MNLCVLATLFACCFAGETPEELCAGSDCESQIREDTTLFQKNVHNLTKKDRAAGSDNEEMDEEVEETLDEQDENEFVAQGSAVPPYVKGNFKSNKCPSGYAVITVESACKAIAKAMSMPWGRTDTWKDGPSGCFGAKNGNAYYNKYAAKGPGHKTRYPLCQQVGCFSGRKDGYYVKEGHGDSNECYDFKTAKTKCEEAGDCGAITSQSNVCSGKYRVTHGGPTLVKFANWAKIKLHAYEYGVETCKYTTTTTSTTSTPEVCDFYCYLYRYPDLAKALKWDGKKEGTAITKAKSHYKAHGKKEGRDCTCNDLSTTTTTTVRCDMKCYLYRYDDIRKALGPENYEKAWNHWSKVGKKEGRDCSCNNLVMTTTTTTTTTTETCLWDCYLSNYGDLRKAFGMSKTSGFTESELSQAAEHYHKWGGGKTEGRICQCIIDDGPKVVCDFQCYLDRYEDLKNAFGTDLKKAEEHWNAHGKKNGRDCRCPDVYVPTRPSKTTDFKVYQGCFKEGWAPDLADEKRMRRSGKGVNVTFQECSDACAGDKFMALGSENICSCGDEFGHYGKATGCDCNHEHGFVGWWMNCVYEYQETTTTTTTTLLPVYRGCNKELVPGSPNKALPVAKGQQTYWGCFQACTGYKYFGRMLNSLCFCGNDNYKPYGAGKYCVCDKYASHVGSWNQCVWEYKTSPSLAELNSTLSDPQHLDQVDEDMERDMEENEWRMKSSGIVEDEIKQDEEEEEEIILVSKAIRDKPHEA